MLALVAIAILVRSFWTIGPTEVGLVRKRFGGSLKDDGPVAFHGEAGYQARLLMPGLRFKLWPLYTVTRHPMVQIPAGLVGVVIAQVGAPLPIGAKSAAYKPQFGNFQDLAAFVTGGGEKGVQRPVLPPGTVAPIHPVGFMVITRDAFFGTPIDETYARAAAKGALKPQNFGLEPRQLEVVRIEPQVREDGKIVDMIGIVTTLDGSRWPRAPSPTGSATSTTRGAGAQPGRHRRRAGGDAAVGEERRPQQLPGLPGFLDNGGRIGLQHDPLLYGAYNLNPFLVAVEMMPMLVVQQGQVAVMKAYVGLATEDTSGADFKFGHLVRPGHRGIWQEPLRTGKYAINPRCYSAEIVPTFILTLNWADANSTAHNLRQGPSADRRQEPRGLRLRARPAGADPRARHRGAEGDLHGRHHDQPGQRGAAGRGRQPLPRQAAVDAGHRLHPEAPGGAGRGAGAHRREAEGVPGRDARGLHPGRGVPRAAGARC